LGSRAVRMFPVPATKRYAASPQEGADMAKKIWDPERKLAFDSGRKLAPQDEGQIAGGEDAENETDEKTLDEKFDEMIRGEYRDAFIKKVKEVLAARPDEMRPGSDEEKRRRAQENVERQIKQVKALYKDFDLATEMGNPHFAALVRAGVDFVSAYEVAHKDELMTAAMAYAARRAAKAAADNIQTRARRTGENGVSARGSLRPRARSVADMTREERDALMKRAMNGERIVL